MFCATLSPKYSLCDALSDGSRVCYRDPEHGPRMRGSVPGTVSMTAREKTPACPAGLSYAQFVSLSDELLMVHLGQGCADDLAVLFERYHRCSFGDRQDRQVWGAGLVFLAHGTLGPINRSRRFDDKLTLPAAGGQHVLCHSVPKIFFVRRSFGRKQGVL